MKKSVLFMLLLCVSIIGSSLVAQEKKEKKNNKETVLFDVSMTCDNCKKRIEKNIPFEKGVNDMKVDLPNKTVMIVYQNNKTDISKLRTALEKMGYEVNIHQD